MAPFTPTHPWPAPSQVVYHWTHVDRTTVLLHARQYEQAYEALVGGIQTPPPSR